MNRDGDSPVCVAVIEAIAEANETDPHDLAFSLHDHVNTEALELFVNHGPDSGVLRFEAPENEVVVRGDGTIVVDGETIDRVGD